MKPCFRCSQFIDESSRMCPHCGGLQPHKGPASNMGSRQASAAAAKESIKLPQWLDGLHDLALWLKEHPHARLAAEWGCAAAGFALGWTFSGQLKAHSALIPLEGGSLLALKAGLGALVGWSGMHFGSVALDELAGALHEVVGQERETRLKRGEMERKSKEKF